MIVGADCQKEDGEDGNSLMKPGTQVVSSGGRVSHNVSTQNMHVNSGSRST